MNNTIYKKIAPGIPMQKDEKFRYNFRLLFFAMYIRYWNHQKSNYLYVYGFDK